MVYIFFLIILATIFFPGYIIILLLVNMVVSVFLSCMHIIEVFFSRFEPVRRTRGSTDFVSVLVPAHNEPPALLMETLNSLSKLKYDQFEVIVIDNNTVDPSVWKPVESYVKTLGDRFRFLHVENLEGYKSGALNYALTYVNKNATYVAVVDADYVVRSDFLRLAVSYFASTSIALVQFPQRYRNVNVENRPVVDEYRHFFKVFMNTANHLDCVPSTGTVSVYRLDVLRKLNGFRGNMLTEDADVGLRIYGAGYRGVYVERTVGHGLIPYDMHAYRKQKRRWAFGNAQSLVTLFGLFGKIPYRSWFGFLSHLTAWGHWHFLPFAVLGAYVIVMLPAIPLTQAHMHLLTMAAVSIFVTIVAKFVVFVATFRNYPHTTLRSLKALMVHMGMTLLYSEAWVSAFVHTKLGFERTNKFAISGVSGVFKNSYKELLLGAWFFLGAIEALVMGRRPITIVAFCVSSVALFAICYIYWTLRTTNAYSTHMLKEMEHKYIKFLFAR